MDTAKRLELVERLKSLGLPSPERPSPLVTLEEFLIGNDDYGSIGCNLTPMLGPQFFFEKLKFIRSQPSVQDVLVEVIEVEEEDPTMWPFADRVYVFTDRTPEDVAHWTVSLQPDAIEKGFVNGKPYTAPELKPGYNATASGGTDDKLPCCVNCVSAAKSLRGESPSSPALFGFAVALGPSWGFPDNRIS